MFLGKADNKSIFILMIKKTLFGVIGLVGFMAIMLASPANAAGPAPVADQQTRILLGQTLNILQTVLNGIEAKAGNEVSPITNSAVVISTLGNISRILVVIDTQLSGLPSNYPTGNQSATLPTGSLEGSGASVTSADKGTANAASVITPKLLFVLLPILILVVVAFSFFRKKDDEQVKSPVAVAEA